MKKTKLFLLLSIFIISSVFSLRLDYYDGHTEHTDSLYYQNGNFGFNGKQVNRDDIKGVRFVIDKKQQQSSKAAPAKVAEAKPLEKDMFWIFKKASQMQEKYPDASGLILWDRGGYYLKKDGSRVYRYHFLGKILKEDTKGWGELNYGIEEGRDKVEFVKARTITSDGKYYSFDPASVKESVPSDSSSSLSKNRKIKNASIPNAEVGTFVEYIIEKTTYNPFNKDFFFPSFGFQSSEPVMLSEFTVQVPENVKLNYVYRNLPDDFTPEVKYNKGMKTYVWTMKDVPPMISEPYSPGYYEIAPVIKCSTLSNWKEFLKWEKGFLEERVIATDYVKEKTLEIVRDAKTKEEKLAKIYHWLQQNIRYLSIKSGIGSGWSGHKAEITLKNKFGDCIDKAILFSAMGKVIGVKIVPIGLLTNTTYKAEYRIPQFNNNHAIVKVYLDGREFYLDTTSENYRYPYFRDDDHGVQVHNPLEEKIDYIPLPDPKDEAMHILFKMDMDRDGNIQLLYTKRYSGSWEAGARGYWKNRREDTYPMIIKGDINSMKAGAKLLDYKFFNVHDISKPFFYYWKVEMKDYLIKAGDLYIMEMPWSEKYFSDISLEKRQYPIMYSSRQWTTYTYILTLPDNYKVKYLPENYAGWYKDIVFANYSYQVKGNKVILTVSHKRMDDRVYPEEYKGYKNFLEDFMTATKQRLVLEKTEGGVK